VVLAGTAALCGDITAGRMGNMHFTQGMWLGIAILMLIPIVMVVLSLILPQPVNRWVSVIVASFFFSFQSRWTTH
jgi:hypothetical protein